MVRNGRWCPCGCGKCVINVGWSKQVSYRCIKCGSKFSNKDFES